MKRAFVLLLTVGILALASPAFALTVDADPGTDMVAGNTYALADSGGFMYIGGKFDAIRGTSNKDMCAADNLVRFTESTGAGDCSWTPAMPGAFVHGVAVLNGFVYAGGDFGLVRVSLATGIVDPSFTITTGQVNAVTAAPNGSGVYIGGAFKRVNGKPHNNIALVNSNATVNGAFQGDLNGTVRHIRTSPTGYLVVSGSFSMASGHMDQSIAELNQTSGAPNASFTPAIPENPMQCFDTAPTASVIYAACGQKQNFMAAFNASNGSQIWRKGLGGNGESISLTTVGGSQTLFVGGHMGTRDPLSEQCGSNYLHGIMKVSAADGTIDCSWDPLLYPDTHNYTGGWVQDVVNGHLWLGGKFAKVDGVQHHAIARWTL
jgi:hypothetical protein